MNTRKPPRHLISTYVTKRANGKYGARVLDGRTSNEKRCTRQTPTEAAGCARDKVLK